jgi:hypothetical protein
VIGRLPFGKRYWHDARAAAATTTDAKNAG